VLLTRRLAGEFVGTGLLVAAVVGSGIAAVRLTDDVALQLLVNALATIAALGVLIWVLSDVSGAHLNPVVTLVAAAARTMTAVAAAGYVAAQVTGGIAGAALANLMFSLPAWTASTRHRGGAGLWLGEVVATAGLVWVVGAAARTGQSRLVPVLVPAWIGAAYFFTSSTSFANPAVTVGRSLTNSFAGIAPSCVAAFIACQIVGAGVGVGLTELFHPRTIERIG
jgi:glycerol uptake facilitator-like aquaporin